MGADKLLLNNEAFFIEVSQMLQSGNSVTLRAKGNSMLPFIMEERDTAKGGSVRRGKCGAGLFAGQSLCVASGV